MFRKTLKRSVSILTLLAMMLTLFPFAAFAEDTTASDLDGHWAEEVMQEWIDYGIIAGYEDGTVRPDRSITRAEMTALLDRVMDYQTTAANHFTDLDDNWYTDVVLKANAAGMISGYPDGTVRPNATISRQEAVAMFARVLSLDTTNAPEADFTDMDAVGDWAKDAVNAMAAKGYVNGDNGQFRPQSGITRAEVITIFNNIFDKLYAESGTYTGDVNGSAVISADDVTLENTAIDGDLIVAEGVGDGHVVLDNVTIDGKLIIRGGGENSVIIRGNSSVGTVTVERIDGAVRVAVEDGASVDTLFVNDGSDTVTVEGTIGTLNVATGAAEVVLNGDTDTLNVSSENAVVTVAGTLGTVTVDEAASDATINIQSDATVSTLTTAATNTTVNVLGSVETVQVADTASDATIAVSENASVSSVTTTAQNTTVSGAGTVTNVEVGETASGATVTTPGTTVENNSSDDVTIGDGETIGAGDTATTPGGTTEEPGEPSTPSEPSRPSHTHTYVDGVCTANDGAYDPTWAQVNSAETWNAAVAAGQNIVLTADFTTDAQLTINNTNSTSDSITVNGNGHTITAAVSEGSSWSTVNGEKHLVLITDAADGSTTANNVTLKNLTLDSDGKAYGLQAYCVTNTVLNNVTLTGSVGAGLTVNGSTVDATALHTSGNNWGGVNVDNGENVSGPTTFTFDATSTFNEDEGKAAVYSETEDVTIIAPAGWACTQVSGNYVWSKLFAGGNGTEASPYLISTAQEFDAINQLASDMGKMDNGTAYYFQQTADFTLTNSVQVFNGVYDGNDCTITAPSSSSSTFRYLFRDAYGNTTFKNLNIESTANCGLSLYSNYVPAYETLTISNIRSSAVNNDVVHINTNNFGFFIINYIGDDYAEQRDIQQLTTIENCTNTASLVNEGTSAGAFIGSGYYLDETDKDHPGKLIVRNCTNSGNITAATNAGSISGNPAYLSKAESVLSGKSMRVTDVVEISNVTNTGTISASSNVGVLATSSGAFATAYPTESIGGTYEKTTTLTGDYILYYDNGTFTVKPGDSTPSYTYKVQLSVGTLYYDQVNFGNSIRFPFDAATVAEEGTLFDTTKVHAYDFNTAKEKSVVTDETELTYQSYNGYDFALFSKDGTLYMIFKNVSGKVDHIDSSVSTLLYAYNGNEYVGHKTITQKADATNA